MTTCPEIVFGHYLAAWLPVYSHLTSGLPSGLAWRLLHLGLRYARWLRSVYFPWPTSYPPYMYDCQGALSGSPLVALVAGPVLAAASGASWLCIAIPRKS